MVRNVTTELWNLNTFPKVGFVPTNGVAFNPRVHMKGSSYLGGGRPH